MRYLLDQLYGKDSTVHELLAQLRSPATVHNPREPSCPLLEVLLPFVEEPHDLCNEFFAFIASAPRQLAEVAADFIREQEESDDLDPSRVLELQRLALMGREMGWALDKFTKSFAEIGPWRKIYNGPIDVMRIWRTKDDEVVGEHESRKLSQTQMPRGMASMVLAENSATGTSQALIAMSTGRYREDPGNPDVREDFLVDIAGMFALGFNKTGRKPPGIHAGGTGMLLGEVVTAAVPVFESVVKMASELKYLKCLEDPKGIFSEKNEYVPRVTLKAEDSPNALIEIGVWA